MEIVYVYEAALVAVKHIEDASKVLDLLLRVQFEYIHFVYYERGVTLVEGLTFFAVNAFVVERRDVDIGGLVREVVGLILVASSLVRSLIISIVFHDSHHLPFLLLFVHTF